MTPAPHDLGRRLAAGEVGDPFAELGPRGAGRARQVTTYQPGALAVAAAPADAPDRESPLTEIAEGLFSGEAPGHGPYVLIVRWPGAEQRIMDPYSFGPLLGDLDIHLFHEGAHLDLGLRMGAQVQTHEGVEGVGFSVWAPNARVVAVIGDFNGWDRRRHPMRLRHDAGVWELFVPGLAAGERYKYAVTGSDGVVRDKADPLARATETPPATASVVAAPAVYAFTDEDWLRSRCARPQAESAISVAEATAEARAANPDKVHPADLAAKKPA